ncbi:BON domain-containing protein [Pseudomonadota bacterium]
MRPIFLLLLSSLIIGQLSGCATAVVGGAATGAAVVYDRRTAPTVLEDQNIEIKAMKQLFDHPEIRKHSNISITSYNHKVLLTGEADTRDISRDYANLVSRIPQVKKVYNEVIIGPSGSMLDRSNDTYLTSKVKAALFGTGIEGFNPTRVKVVTNQGTVYLMGLVTAQEAAAAAEKARFVTGVLKVVKLFDYI